MNTIELLKIALVIFEVFLGFLAIAMTYSLIVMYVDEYNNKRKEVRKDKKDNYISFRE